MKNEMMSSGKGKRKITLDPRTKLALLLMVATFVLGGAGGNELIWARIFLWIILFCWAVSLLWHIYCWLRLEAFYD